MKKLLLIAVLASVAILSCKKDHSPASQPVKKYKVTFNVTNFTQSQKAFAVRHNAAGLASTDTLTALNTYFDVLYYIKTWDLHQGSLVMQDSTMSNMGIITDSIPAGVYNITFIAGKKGLAAGLSFGYGGGPWQDTFWDHFTLTVKDGDPKITQNVTLNRVVGKLEVKLLDNIPADADSLFITLHDEPAEKSAIDANEETVTDRDITFPVAIPASAKGHPNFTVDRITGYPNNYPTYGGVVTIACKDANGHLIATTTTGYVPFFMNQKTILSGNLFSSGTAPQQFTTKIDTTWGSTQYKTFP